MQYILRLFKMARPWYRYLLVPTLALFAVTGINLYTPDIIKQVIALMESGGYADKMDAIIRLAMLLLGLYALRAVGQFLNNYVAHVASWRLVSHVRCLVYDHFQRLSMDYYHDKQTGQLMSCVINDTSTFESMIAHAIPELAGGLVTLAGALVILLRYNWQLTALVCIPVPFLLVTSFVLRRMRRNFRKGQRKIAELNGILQDNFSGMKEIQVFNRQDYELERVV